MIAIRGQIRKRGKKYSIIVQIEDDKGVKKPKWISGYNSKKEAEDDLPRILTELQGGVFVKEKLGFSDYADKWLKHIEKNVKESTYLTYVWAMDKAKERFKNLQLDKIKTLAIQEFLDEQTISKTSINYQFKILTMALSQAITWNLLTKNPCNGVTPPAKNKKKFRPYTNEQIKTLLDGAAKSHIYIPVLIGIACGLRRGEVCALEWSDLDFDKNIVYVRDGKTDNAPRAVTAPPYIMAELKKLRGIGQIVSFAPDYVYRSFKKLVTDLELPEMTFHDLRHLHCSILLMQGVPVSVVSERAGHSSKGFTLNTYSHLLPGAQDQAATVMDSFLNPDSKKIAKKKTASKRKA